MIASTLIDAQRQSLELVTNVQDRLVKANRDLAKSVTGMVDTLPLPEFNAPNLVDTKIVDQAFDMTAEWFKANREFTQNMVEAWIPAAPKAKTAAKATAKKTTKK